MHSIGTYTYILVKQDVWIQAVFHHGDCTTCFSPDATRRSGRLNPIKREHYPRRVKRRCDEEHSCAFITYCSSTLFGLPVITTSFSANFDTRTYFIDIESRPPLPHPAETADLPCLPTTCCIRTYWLRSSFRSSVLPVAT